MNRKFRIIVTSDMHAHFMKDNLSPNHSIMNTAEAIKQIQGTQSDDIIKIDLGDFIQGSIYSIFQSERVGNGMMFTKAMNTIGYDYQVLGNHEFNYSKSYYEEIFNSLDAQILGANILSVDSNRPAYGSPYDICVINDIKVGIIGVTTSIIPAWEKPENISQLNIHDAYETVKHYVQIVRPQVDVLVIAYHGGLGSGLIEDLENQGRRMADELASIDILLTGHMHQNINSKINDTLIVQPGFAGEFVCEITVEVNEDRKVDSKAVMHSAVNYLENEKIMDEISYELKQANKWKNSIVGEIELNQPYCSPNDARVFGHPFIEMINQIQLNETGADFSATTLINNEFQTFNGEISNEQLLNAFPLHNNIAKVKISGADLIAAIEHNFSYLQLNNGEIIAPIEKINNRATFLDYDVYSGLTVNIDITKEVGQRVLEIRSKSDNKLLEEDKLYTIALSQFRATGGRGFERWFNTEKIISVSEESIFDLITKVLSGNILLDMVKVNHNFQQIFY